MAVVKNLMVRAGADFSAITKQANKAKASMSGMQKSISDSCSRMNSAMSGLNKALGAIGVGLSAAALVSFGKSAKEAYDAQAEGETKLAQVMRNTTGASNAEIKSIKDLLSAQQALGVIGDEIQLAGAQELATYVSETKTLKTLIPVMNDMVAQQYGLSASGENASSVATMLGKVLSGQTSGLSRYGYYFDAAQENILKFGTEAQRAATLAEVVEQSVGGMNAALAATPSGRLKQVSNALGDIKEQFGAAVTTGLTAFLPLLNGVADVLADVATLANKVAQSIANVFGGKAVTAAPIVSYTGAAADTMGDLENATKAAGKAAEELSTAGFDTLQKLSFPSTSGGAGDSATPSAAGGGGAITEALGGADEAGESIGILERALERIKKAFSDRDWTSLGKEAGGVFNNLFESVNWPEIGNKLGTGLDGLAKTVYSFAETLDIKGLGSKVAETFNATIGQIDFSVWGALAVRKITMGLDFLLGAFETLDWGLIGKSIGDFLRGAFDEASNWLQSQDWHQIGTDIWKKFKDLIEGIDFPSLADSFFTFLGSAFGASAALLDSSLQEVIDHIKKYFEERTEEMGGNVVMGIIYGMLNAWKDILEWIGEHICKPFVDGFRKAFGIHSPSKVMEEQGGFIIEGVKAGISAKVESVIQKFTDLRERIKGVFSHISDWFRDTFSDAWQKVKDVFSSGGAVFTGITDGMLTSFKAVVNKLIDGINNVIAVPFNGINTSLQKIRNVSILGLTPFTGINTISVPKLPRLADGALLPPNREFAAILGDQTSGMNIEAPERLLRQVYREESNNDKIIDLLEEILTAARARRKVYVDDTALGRASRRFNEREDRAIGR